VVVVEFRRQFKGRILSEATGKFNILVVDDEPDKRHLLATALQLEGYKVETASDGIEGLAAIESHPPDLVISDVMMPRMDGFEMIRRVRANPETAFIPIIIQSAVSRTSRDLRRGAQVGALDFITDPTDLELLIARARTLLDYKNFLDTYKEAANTDHLTGLANRRRFERQLDREVTRTKRYGRPFCLLLIDIDHFKAVNDTYGHPTGDEVIVQLASTLQAGTRGIDTAARVGGEEFAVILPETEITGGLEVANRLRESIGTMDLPAEVGRVTASIGIAEYPASAGDGTGLYAAADSALYAAKRTGRNRVVGADTPQTTKNDSAPLGVS
jgi:diguanylate cyclase (GGDEF)-like protein